MHHAVTCKLENEKGEHMVPLLGGNTELCNYPKEAAIHKYRHYSYYIHIVAMGTAIGDSMLE